MKIQVTEYALFCVIGILILCDSSTTKRPPAECVICNGINYTGDRSQTNSGKTCQRWDSSSPHQHSYHPDQRPGRHLENNYCRNPDGERQPWCYTTDPNTRWEYCDIAKCRDSAGRLLVPLVQYTIDCVEDRGKNYRGHTSRTKSGKTCANWNSQSPHEHTRTPENYPCSGLISNRCRNPDYEEGPWCYTTDVNTRWEACDVPKCGPDGTTQHPLAECVICNGINYTGDRSQTNSGKTCQRWDSSSPHEHSNHPDQRPGKNLENNYCRNPDEERQPWCYTTDPNTRWEYCDITKCRDSAGRLLVPLVRYTIDCVEDRGQHYRGHMSQTKSGKTCANWNSQSPHEHTRTPENYPCSGLILNRCRNPDYDEAGPWCYTTDANTRWEACDVPKCGPDGRPAPADNF